MGIVIDSSVFIATERHRFHLPRFLSANPGEQFYIAAITASELLHGYFRASNETIKVGRKQFVEDIFRDYTLIPFGIVEAQEHARIWADLEMQGRIIGERDLQIAATAKANGYSIATLNRTEFERVPDLKLIDLRSFVLSS